MSGSFSEFIRVSFVYPFSVLTADSAAPISRLLGSLLWLLATSFPLAILAAVSLFRSASPGARAVKLILIVWLVAALFVMLIQRNSWWAYHTTLLKPPLLMLGLIVLAQLAARADWWPECPTLKLAGGSLCLLFALAAAPAYSQLQRKLDLAFVFTISYEDQQRYLNALAPGYPAVQRQSQWSRAQRASSLCVIGDPAVLFFAGKQCPVSVATWSGAALSKEMWRRMATEFSLTRPELVYVAASDRKVVEEHAPDLLLWLEANYDFVALGRELIAGTEFAVTTLQSLDAGLRLGAADRVSLCCPLSRGCDVGFFEASMCCDCCSNSHHLISSDRNRRHFRGMGQRRRG